MTIAQDSQLNEKTQNQVDRQLDVIKKILPPFPATTNIFAKQPNKLYSKVRVQEMMYELIEFLEQKDLWEEFEQWLNDKWLNGNNGDNEWKYPLFLEDLVNSIIS